MDLTRSPTVQVLGVLGVVISAASALSFDWHIGAGALAVTTLVGAVGFTREHGRALNELVQFKPVGIGQVDAVRCGVDKTAPWILEKSDARDGQHLLQFVSRAEARAVGRRLARAVANEASVVVALIGEAKAGKTRCMFEAVRARIPEAVVFAPKDLQALRVILASRRFRSPRHWSVLWLDDLENYMDLATGRGVDDALLDELLGLPRVVVAITAEADWDLEHLNDAPILGRLIPGHGHDGQVIVSVLGQALADEVGAEGLGAACVAGPSLLKVHTSARFHRQQAVPEGQIVVECLIAAAQLSMGSLAREELLSVYRQTETVHGSEGGFDRGLRWATTALYGEIALVLGDDEGYRVYSYVAGNAVPIGEYREHAERALAATIPVNDLLERAARASEAYNQLERALRFYELALQRIDDEALQAATIGDLGIVQYELGRFEDALATLQRALAIKEHVYGPDHHEVAVTLTNLGIVQYELGRLEDALATLQRALAIKEHVYGPDHHQVASTLGNLGIVQQELGRLEDALATQQRALAIKEHVYGPDHHQVASTLGNLGIVQRELGRAVDAEVSFRRELSICQDHLPEDHPHTRRARLRLAQLVAARGEVLLNIPNDDHLLPTDRDDREIDA